MLNENHGEPRSVVAGAYYAELFAAETAGFSFVAFYAAESRGDLVKLMDDVGGEFEWKSLDFEWRVKRGAIVGHGHEKPYDEDCSTIQ